MKGIHGAAVVLLVLCLSGGFSPGGSTGPGESTGDEIRLWIRVQALITIYGSPAEPFFLDAALAFADGGEWEREQWKLPRGLREYYVKWEGFCRNLLDDDQGELALVDLEQFPEIDEFMVDHLYREAVKAGRCDVALVIASRQAELPVRRRDWWRHTVELFESGRDPCSRDSTEVMHLADH